MLIVFSNLLSIISSALAAYFWFRSGKVAIPQINVGYGGTGGSLDDLKLALNKQGTFSCYGAIAASVSALAQLFNILLSSYSKLT